MAPANTVVISPNVAMFYCEAVGVLTPNISWQMNGNYLESRGDVEISIDTRDSRRNSTLYIRNTVPSDAGNYTCVAATAAGNVSASAVLTVNCTFQPLTIWVDVSLFLSLSPAVAPEITDPPLESVVTVTEETTATFVCTATGIPGPTISWRRENGSNDFTEDSRVTLGTPTAPEPVSTPNGTIYSVTRQLTLSNTRDSDSGVYFCEASSGEEDILNVELPFELFVRGTYISFEIETSEQCNFVLLANLRLIHFLSYSSDNSCSRGQDRSPWKLSSVHVQCDRETAAQHNVVERRRRR